MRKSLGLGLALVAASSIGLATALERKAAEQSRRIFGHDNIKRTLQKRGRSYDSRGSIATGNRWGGPHLHQREISRRLRQAALTAGAVN